MTMTACQPHRFQLLCDPVTTLFARVKPIKFRDRCLIFHQAVSAAFRNPKKKTHVEHSSYPPRTLLWRRDVIVTLCCWVSDFMTESVTSPPSLACCVSRRVQWVPIRKPQMTYSIPEQCGPWFSFCQFERSFGGGTPGTGINVYGLRIVLCQRERYQVLKAPHGAHVLQ